MPKKGLNYHTKFQNKFDWFDWIDWIDLVKENKTIIPEKYTNFLNIIVITKNMGKKELCLKYTPPFAHWQLLDLPILHAITQKT